MENKKEIIRPCTLDMEDPEIEREKSDTLSLTSSSSKNIEEIECKINDNDKFSNSNFSINDKYNCSDSTSHTDNLSYTSESSFFYFGSNGTQSINYNVQNKNNVNLNYYEGAENFFKKIMPEKFYEYKKTKNYIPKTLLNEKNRTFFIKKAENTRKTDKNKQKNKFDNSFISFQNTIYYPMIGNLYFYKANNFYFNYPFFNINNNETNKIEESKKEKEKQIENEINNNKNEDSEENKDLNIYIIKKKEKHQKYKKNSNDEKNQKSNYNNSNKEPNLDRNKISYNNHKKNNNYYYKKNNINNCDNGNYYNLNENNHWKSKNNINFSKYNKFNKFNNYDNRRNQYSFNYY